jgi:hypothetical protein
MWVLTLFRMMPWFDDRSRTVGDVIVDLWQRLFG